MSFSDTDNKVHANFPKPPFYNNFIDLQSLVLSVVSSLSLLPGTLIQETFKKHLIGRSPFLARSCYVLCLCA